MAVLSVGDSTHQIDAPDDAASVRAKLPYFPALDGLRGVAVAAVILFHSGFSWMVGGYLGVSTFFTLSGFLITSLLLAERGATATINLRNFWQRRIRRLMPAAFAALALALAFAVLAGDATQKRNLAGDVISALGYVANWRFVFAQQSYADLFGSHPSPVLHFWSLAVEEQYYLFYPLFAYALLARRRVNRQVFGMAVGALVAVSMFLPHVIELSQDRFYYGTDARAAELLIGGLLAIAIYNRRVTQRLAQDNRVKLAAAALGCVGLAGSIACWILVDQRSSALYQGGLGVYAVLSAMVILASIVPVGPVRWVLRAPPLRALGRISYGVYLYHWPIFLWVNEDRTGLSPAILLAARLIPTLAIAALSYRFLEMPIRRGEPILRARPIRIAPYACAFIAVAVIAVSVVAPKQVIDFEAAAEQLQAIGDNDAPPPKALDPTAAEPPFPRMAMFGDSTAMMTAFGVNAWATESHKADYVDGAAWLGCGIGRGGERRNGHETGPIPEHCNHWEVTWNQKIRDNKPNIALVQIGPWEVTDRKLPGDSVWRAPGDPVYDAYLLEEMQVAVDTLSSDGAEVIWLTSPTVGGGLGDDVRLVRDQAADPMRMQRLNELIGQLPALKPGRVQVVDLAKWLAESGDDARLRPDGVHFGPDQAKEVCDRWLGQAIVDAFRADWKRRHELTAAIGSSTTAPTVPDEPPTTIVEPPTTKYTGPKRKLLVLGDSTAVPLADALRIWGESTGALEVFPLSSPPECGILEQTSRDNKGSREPTPAECGEDLTFAWLGAVVNYQPDLVMIVPSVWDLTDQQFPGDPQWRAPGDPVFDETMRRHYAALVDAIRKAGPLIAWLTYPPIEWGKADNPPPASPYPASDPARLQRMNSLVSDNTFDRGFLLQIDFAKYASRWPGGEKDPTFRPDGVAISPAVGDQVAAWLGPELLTRYDQYQATGK